MDSGLVRRCVRGEGEPMRTKQRQIIEEHVEQTDDATIHHFITSDQREWPMQTLVIKALDRVTEKPVDEMEPLSNHIDPEALDRLFHARSNGQPRGDGKVTFPWDGHRVTVTNEQITIKKRT